MSWRNWRGMSSGSPGDQYLSAGILLFLTLIYPTAVLSGLRIVVLFNKLQFYKKRLLELLFFNQGIPMPVSYSNKASS